MYVCLFFLSMLTNKTMETPNLAVLIAIIALLISLISYFTINKRIEEKIRIQSTPLGYSDSEPAA